MICRGSFKKQSLKKKKKTNKNLKESTTSVAEQEGGEKKRVERQWSLSLTVSFIEKTPGKKENPYFPSNLG